MSLRSILATVVSELGVSPTNESELSYVKAHINAVARDMWSSIDVLGSEREAVVSLGDNQLVALPYYMQKLIAMRNYNSRIPIEGVSNRARYLITAWQKNVMGRPWYNYRVHNYNSALERDITNAGKLTVKTGTAESNILSVNIIGSTATKSKTQETLVFDSQNVLRTTKNLFSSVDAIVKSGTSDSDITITDMDNVRLALIPNNQTTSQYTIVQVLERLENPVQAQLVEVLYKIRFNGFANDDENLPSGDMFDQVLVFKTLARIALLRGNSEQAMLYNEKATVDYNAINANLLGPVEKMMNFGKNPTHELHEILGGSVVTRIPRQNYLVRP